VDHDWQNLQFDQIEEQVHAKLAMDPARKDAHHLESPQSQHRRRLSGFSDGMERYMASPQVHRSPLMDNQSLNGTTSSKPPGNRPMDACY
jgi:hypothetical protein